jgi:hypothetical protein
VTTPGNGDDAITLKMADRIHKIAVDGYVRIEGNRWILTLKGWAVLFAEAEPPMYKPKGKSP